MKRNQVLIREGDSKKEIFIVKIGQFQINKNVMMPKQSELAYQQKLLKSKTHVQKRFRNTFNRQVGMKVDENLKLLIAGEGKMMGDFEAINDVPS